MGCDAALLVAPLIPTTLNTDKRKPSDLYTLQVHFAIHCYFAFILNSVRVQTKDQAHLYHRSLSEFGREKRKITAKRVKEDEKEKEKSLWRASSSATVALSVQVKLERRANGEYQGTE